MGMIKPERDSWLDELITKEEAVNAIEQAFNEAVKGLDVSSPVYGLLHALDWDQQVPHHTVVTCTGGT